MMRRAVKRTEELVLDENRPTAERLRHGPIERLDRAIADAQGNASRPYRALDTLAVMERRGSITAGMRQAGEDFRARFATAQLDPLRALDLSQLRLGDRPSRSGEDGPGLRIEAARDAVWRAIQAIGGIASPAGSCVWHVVGWECSLKAWAARARLERPPRQSGIRVRNSGRRARRVGSAFRQWPDDAKIAYCH